MHRVYRTLDEPPSFIQGLEAEDLAVAVLSFSFWNALISAFTGIKLVAILYVPLLGGGVLATLYLWVRLKARMPRGFIRDGLDYLRQGEIYEAGPDLEAVPLFIGREAAEEAPESVFGGVEEGSAVPVAVAR